MAQDHYGRVAAAGGEGEGIHGSPSAYRLVIAKGSFGAIQLLLQVCTAFQHHCLPAQQIVAERRGLVVGGGTEGGLPQAEGGAVFGWGAEATRWEQAFLPCH